MHAGAMLSLIIGRSNISDDSGLSMHGLNARRMESQDGLLDVRDPVIVEVDAVEPRFGQRQLLERIDVEHTRLLVGGASGSFSNSNGLVSRKHRCTCELTLN